MTEPKLFVRFDIVGDDCSEDCMARMKPTDEGFWMRIQDHERVVSSRDTEIREVLEGLSYVADGIRHWCGRREPCTPACLAARGLWNRVQQQLGGR